jgi:hypothetical protein
MLFGRRRGGTLVGGAEALMAAGVLEDTALDEEPATVAIGQSTDGDDGR